MTFEFYVITLLACAAATAYLTQKAKNFLDKKKVKYASNMVAVIVGFAVGVVVAIIEVMAAGFTISVNTILFIVAVGIGSIAGAMFGYDKVVQWLRQIKTIKEDAQKVMNGDTQTSIDTVVKEVTDTASDIAQTVTDSETEGEVKKNE